jgi:anti-sigma factor RsiW
VTTINSQDDTLRKYFLGRLPENEIARFEEEIAQDAALFDAAVDVENELIDDYARGSLSASDVEAFGSSYLLTDLRREKVELAKAFLRAADERFSARVVKVTASPLSFWGLFENWGKAFAGAVAVIAVVAGLIYLVTRPAAEVDVAANRDSQNQAVTFSPIASPPNDSIVPVNNTDHSSNSGNNIIRIPKNSGQKPPSSAAIPASSVATFTLVAGALRDEGDQSVNIPLNAREISLRLDPPKDLPKYASYSASVKTADGESVLNISNLRSFRFRVPASKLESRTYIIFLEGKNAAGTAEPIAEYTFRVRGQKDRQ